MTLAHNHPAQITLHRLQQLIGKAAFGSSSDQHAALACAEQLLQYVPSDVPAQLKPSKASEVVGTSGSASASKNVPALTEQDAVLLEQAASMLEGLESDERNRGNCSTAEGAGCSAHAVRRLAAGLLSYERAHGQAKQQVTCETCNDHGMIGGPSFYDPGEGGQPCPDCEERHRNGLAAGDLVAWAAEVGGNRIAENVVEMTREDLQRLIAERTPQTAPAAVAVPAKYFSYSGECGIETHTTEAEARAACEEMVQACRDEAADGWPDDVDTIIWGIVLGETKERILGQVEDPVAAGFDYHAEYDLVTVALAATPEALPDMVSVKRVDANKYCQILAALGMEEEGDPVAEVQNLQALAVTSILLDVVPGSDGMGHEVYATSVEDVVEKLSDLGSRLEDYQLGIAVAPQALAGHRDVAFEAVRQKFCKLQRYSFFLDDKGNVRRTPDYCGNWVEFEAVHTLFEPAAVEAALAAQATQGGD